MGEDAHATAGQEAGATVWGPRRSATVVEDLKKKARDAVFETCHELLKFAMK